MPYCIAEFAASCPGAHVGEQRKSDNPTWSDRPRTWDRASFAVAFLFCRSAKEVTRIAILTRPVLDTATKAKVSIVPVSSERKMTFQEEMA